MANEFVARNGIISLDSSQITGSLRVTQGVTASLFGTASWALNSTTASFVLNAVSSSFAATASFIATSSLAGNFFSQGGNSFGALALLGTNDNQALAFETNGSEKMRLAATRNNFLVNQTGSLGGVTASIELSGNGINDSTEQASYQIYANHGTFAANTGYFIFNKSRGTTQGAVTAVASGDRLGMIRWNGADGASQVRAAEIYAEVDGAVSTNDMPGRLIFATTLDGASTPTERMRITNAGLVGIGTTSPNVSGQASGVGVLTIQGSTNYGIIELSQNASTSDGTLAGAVGFTNNQLSAGYKLHAYIGSWLQGGGVTSGGDLRFYTQISGTAGAIERMRIFSDGNVGIGTTVASARLHVSGTLGGVFQVNGAAAVNALYVSASGNVGIATTSPSQKLDVVGRLKFRSDGTSTSGVWFTGNTGTEDVFVGLQDLLSTSAWGVYSASSWRFTILNGGSVGIGTTSPVNTLHVVGTGRFTDSLAVSTAVSTGDAFIELGTGRSGSGNAYIDLVGDTTYTDFALRIIRGSAGANATSQIIHRGTGAFSIIAQDAASLALSTSNSARLTILSGGSIGIGTTTAGSLLQVNGNTAIGYAASTAAPTNGLTVSGSVGIGTTLAPWTSTFRVLQLGARTALLNSDINFTGLYNNFYYDGAAYRYLTSAAGSSIELGGGVITFGTIASGTAGNTAAGSERMRITNDGNVGIGTTAPVARLHVSGSVSGSTFQAAGTGRAFFTQNVGTNSVWAEFINTGGNFYVGRDNSTGTSFGTGTAYSAVFYESGANPMVFFTNASQRMRIASDGNVGINTSSPNYRLEVAGGSSLSTAHFTHNGANGGINVHNTSSLTAGRDAQLRLANGTTYFGASDRSYQLVNEGASTTTADFYIQYWNGTSYNQRFRINSSGNVGIGTTSPQSILHINGSAPKLFLQTTSNTNYTEVIFYSGSAAAADIWVNAGGQTDYGGANSLNIGTNQNAPITFRTNGLSNERMRIAADGNVGIGQSSPTNKLDISVSNRTSLSAQASAIVSDYAGSTTGQYQTIGFSWASSISSLVSYWGLGFRATNYASGLGDTFLYAGGAERLTVTNGGNVIIGGTTSTYKLHVVSAPGSVLALGEESFSTGKQLLIGINASADTEIQAVHQGTAYTDILLNPSGGSVGIGTTAPAAALEVNGAIQTDSPSGGSKKPWKLGNVVATSVVLDENNYVEVEINGTAYKLALVNPA